MQALNGNWRDGETASIDKTASKTRNSNLAGRSPIVEPTALSQPRGRRSEATVPSNAAGIVNMSSCTATTHLRRRVLYSENKGANRDTFGQRRPKSRNVEALPSLVSLLRSLVCICGESILLRWRRAPEVFGDETGGAHRQNTLLYRNFSDSIFHVGGRLVAETTNPAS